MRATRLVFGCLWLFLATNPARGLAAAPLQEGRVVDRIVARIEGDIILLSQVRELGEFQELIQGQRGSDDQLLSELIEQWVVQTEATGTHFPQPAKSEVDREMNRISAQFPSPAAFAEKLAALDLTIPEVRALLTEQIYLERYIDYKFRAAVQIDTAAVTAYYKDEFVPALAAKNEQAPPLTAVDAQIREVLIQRAISQHVAQWLDETKSHLKIETSATGSNPE